MAQGGLRAKHRKQRTEQVLSAAQSLFGKWGYEGTHIEAIAAKASVSTATVYNYFTTKPNLLMELALRHVQVALPERRNLIRDLPDDPVRGILAFEKLLADQATRHLSRDCWRVIMSAQYIEPDGPASRTGARLNTLIRRHYVRLFRTYQQRGRISGDVDPFLLADVIVDVTTAHFGNFVASDTSTVADMLTRGERHIRLIISSMLSEQSAAA
ncbi:TetR/AcrR family transcriptional regulator [Arsenicitalea aurantiaca]|uniref:TetR/AcrR family transcriptional regulator n=1 Tax=Arsenicitalea aurantiaca TaxID=1783274 RepID=A0A433X7P7_9HYPH|nr:TetR/AcrR family transcriptional regulator [Arsenicitalea aurantiaca]RUT30073.1 TetR/AcrR family transcriptional regulator [Arsenicitalea aurantiaca]